MMPGIVTFVGAGPGDPELLTIKGRKAIEEAQIVLYAGLHISPAIVALANAETYDTVELDLDDAHTIVRSAAARGLKIVRIHSGDPSIYGALAEQIELLDRDHIPWRVIPGVTAAMAAAAATGVSFSIPEINQTLIITRLGGRTAMPPNEDLADLASRGTAMAIYMAGHKCAQLKHELERTLPVTTAIICASRLGWPNELIVYTTLGELAKCAIRYNFGRETLILVLPGDGIRGSRSRKYDPVMSQNFRSSAGG